MADFLNVPKNYNDISAAQVRALLGGKDDPVIVEVGCNDSETTKSFLEAMPQARVFAFEPDPRPIARFLCRNDPRVTLFRCAISHKFGTATFHQSGGKVPGSTAPCANDWDYSGSLCKPTGHLARDEVVKFPSDIIVNTYRLDDFLGDFPPIIDFLFCDVQGAEARLILGGQQVLDRTRWFYTEFYNVEQYERQADLKGLLSFLPDWDLVATYGDNALFVNKEFKDNHDT